MDYDPQTGEVRKKETVQGFSDDSAWARGQAWALYGFTMMFRESGHDSYLTQARNIADMLLSRLPEDGVPYWDFDSDKIPNDLRDASAGAIMASAFVQLSTLTDDEASNAKYLAMAEKQLRTLASPEYLAEPGTNGNFILKDYYFLEALLKYKNITDK